MLIDSGDIGSMDESDLPLPLPSGDTNNPSEPAPILDSDRQALERLVSHAVPQGELPSVIETIVSSMRAADIVECLRESDAQTFIDVTDEARHQVILSLGNLFINILDFGQALDTLNFAPRIRKKCVKSLYKMCAGHALLPRSLHFELLENPVGVVMCRGGFADVLKREYHGRDIAVKALRVYDNNCRQDTTSVSHHGASIPLHASVN